MNEEIGGQPQPFQSVVQTSSTGAMIMANTENEDTKTPAEIEKDRAKRENKQNRDKQTHEDKIADYTSPEQMRKDGGEVHPTQSVVPSQPDPSVNEEYRGTRYDGNGGKGE